MEAIGQRLPQQFARRPDFRRIGKIPHHRLQALLHVFRDAVEQKRDGLRRAARDPAALAAMRGRTGWVRRSGSKPCRLVRRSASIWPSTRVLPAASDVAQSIDLSVAQDGASLAPWTPRQHHHAPSPATCAARCSACRDAFAHLPKLALDIALPTLCVSCREPVDGEGVCAECWAKLSLIAPPFCPRLGIPFVYDPGPELLSMEAIASPPAYQRARAAEGYHEVARTLDHSLKYQDRTDLGARDGPLDGPRGSGIAR